MGRAAETATIIAGVCGLEVVRLEGLKEVEIGPYADPVDPQTRLAAGEALRAWVIDGKLDQSHGRHQCAVRPPRGGLGTAAAACHAGDRHVDRQHLDL